LFIVEALRAGWTPGRSLSPRVQSVIRARLAQLSPAARDLVELVATIGREFGTDIVGVATELDEDTLTRSLDELWRRRIIRERGAETYDFSHDQIRQVAYTGLSPARRRGLHLRIATALERVNSARPEQVSAQVAMHYDRAGAAELAITWYRRAAQAAQLLHANAQAVRLLRRAVTLLQIQPVSADRDAAELAVQTALLAPLFAVEGYASPGVTAAQQRARELTDSLRVDVTPPLLRSLALSALTKADFQLATRFGQLLLAAGERDRDEVLVVEAGYVLGVASFWQADFGTARRYLELAVERYRPEDRRAHLIRYGQDPKVVCLSRLGNVLWFLGQPDEARNARSAALAWAGVIDHPYSRAVALAFGALLALDMGDEREMRAHTAALVAAGPGPAQVHLVAAAFRGYLAVLDGTATQGIAEVRQVIKRARGRPAAPGIEAMLGRILLAACMASGDDEAAVAAASRLLDMGGAACVWEPEALRIRAELGPPG
jgi:tetratricopeptide (TPR) repeat protein